MTRDDPKIIRSPLCQDFTADGITVRVEIFKVETLEGWSLELIDEDWNSIVWDGVFPSDKVAWDVFQLGVQEFGLERILSPSEDGLPTVH
jgi:hypothetical protein